MDRVARSQALGGPGKGAPAVLAGTGMHVKIDAGRSSAALLTRRPLPGQGCRDDAGIVQHQKIAGLQQRRQVQHGVITQRPALAHMQEARRIPRPGGPKCNAVFGQVEVKV